MGVEGEEAGMRRKMAAVAHLAQGVRKGLERRRSGCGRRRRDTKLDSRRVARTRKPRARGLERRFGGGVRRTLE